MSVRVSVVIPTYCRRELLLRCVAALMQQDFDPHGFEIIVADDESSDETRQALAQWMGESGPRIRYLAVGRRRGPAATRNAGWRAAAGEIVAFTDDDCIPQPKWLGAGVAALESGADAAWGRLEMPLSASPTDYELDAAGLAKAVFVTANCFCRRAALERAGGFDERFAVAWREDSDLYFSLLEQNCRVVHAPAALVVHPIRPARWGVSLKQQSKSRFDVLLLKKHPRLYARFIPPLPRLYYVAVASGAAALAGAASGWMALAWPGALVWSGATLLFCGRRLRGTSKAPAHVLEMAVTSALIPPLSLYWRARGLWKYRTLSGAGRSRIQRSAPASPHEFASPIGSWEHETT